MCGLRNISAAKKFDDLVVEVRSLLIAIVRTGHITYQDFEAQVGRANADRWRGRERPSPADISQARPLLFGKMRACLGFLGHNFLNLLHNRVRVLIGGGGDPTLIAKPPRRARETEKSAVCCA